MQHMVALAISSVMACMVKAQQNPIDLAGRWDFAIGEKPSSYNEHIDLPGSMLTNGKGDDVNVNTQWVGSLYDSSFYYNPYMEKYRQAGRMKFPFFLTPSKHYVGTAWYRRSVIVPKAWSRKRVVLFLERPHIATSVFINGHLAGRDSSLSVPHEFDITPYVYFGKLNTVEICVDNRIERVGVGQDSHSVTDQTQGDWNGIVGQMQLRTKAATYLRTIKTIPNIGSNSLTIVASLVGDKGRKHRLALSTAGHDTTVVFRGDSVSLTMHLGPNVKQWDEFTPQVYSLCAVLDRQDTLTTRFGMARMTAKGRQLYINGRPVWIRGTVENCCFPLTGYPPTDVDSWLAIFRKCKDYGLNMMRFHSYCPPEAAFVAADSVGFYLQPEGPSWPNHGVKLGKGMTIDNYLMDETRRMVEQYGNHPSFCMLAAGNEPAGDWVTWAGCFVDYWKEVDPRRLYCGASVGGGWAFDPKSQYHVKGGARGLDWDKNAPQSVDDYHEKILSYTQKGRTPITYDINEPYISHEQGQWCAFPDLKETSQYTGAYKAENFNIFADLLRDGGMAEQADKFLLASGRLQTLAYKFEIERNLRTPDYAGFQLLGLNDYSGQGTALVGVLNVFWREKGYCQQTDWRQFCSSVVPLARFGKFVFTNEETLEVDVELYNAYKETLNGAQTTYTITDDKGKVFASGILSKRDIPIGKNNSVGVISFALNSFNEPTKLTLSVSCIASDQPTTIAYNHWNFWVYPSHVDQTVPKGIYIADTLDAKAVGVLRQGGKVLMLAAGKVRLGSDVKQTYLPVFWNTSWFKMRPPHTTGAVIDTSHPLFRLFPSDDWANINWWELLNNAQVMNLRELPAQYQSPIQPIDTWHVSRKLGMVIEANVEGGKLLMTTMDLTSDLGRRVVARQMRRAILDYMESDTFRPSLKLAVDTITDFFERQAPTVNMFTNDSPDELKPKLK